MSTVLAMAGPRKLQRGELSWAEQQLEEFLHRAMDKFGDVRVLSGMAVGIDTLWAEVAIRLGIPFEAYIPSDLQTGWARLPNGDWFSFTNRAWPARARDYWVELITKADRVVDCSKTFPPDGWQSIHMLLLHRNKCMVHDCQFAGAVWHGKKGGTSHFIEYALFMKRMVFHMDLTTKMSQWNKFPHNPDGSLKVLID